MEYTIAEIAQLIDGEVIGDKDKVINAPAKIEEGFPGSITFLADDKYEKFIYDSQSSAAIVKRDFEPKKDLSLTLIKVENVYGALATLMDKFQSQDIEISIADTSKIDSSTELGKECHIGEFVQILKDSKIGDNCILHHTVYIGEGVKIGKNVVLMPGVRVYKNCKIGDNVVVHANSVIGSDGFGFSKDEKGKYKKIPQLGNVIIEDDVEIGSNTCIDRATMGSTIIRKGVKLDNLIQIGHNVEIGAHTVIAAQTGIAGSTKIGKHCMIGGQVGIKGHTVIADGTMIQAQSGVGKKVSKPGTRLYGTPAIEYNNYLKSYAHFKNLPDIIQEIGKLRKQIANLEAESQRN